jgi:calcineurin-like phosphoesterase
MGWWLDGQASFVFGTHTHIQTADERILPQGTAYITDCGMTGPYESVIGRRVDRVLHRFTTGMPAHFEVATGDVRLCGALATIDTGSGRATEIKRVVITEDGTVKS